MSDAKKCDRCGTFYEKHIRNRIYRLTRETNHGSTTPTNDFQPEDLCPECYDKLTEWYE